MRQVPASRVSTIVWPVPGPTLEANIDIPFQGRADRSSRVGGLVFAYPFAAGLRYGFRGDTEPVLIGMGQGGPKAELRPMSDTSFETALASRVDEMLDACTRCGRCVEA